MMDLETEDALLLGVEGEARTDSFGCVSGDSAGEHRGDPINNDPPDAWKDS